jgi:hypothetical protein
MQRMEATQTPWTGINNIPTGEKESHNLKKTERSAPAATSINT